MLEINFFLFLILLIPINFLLINSLLKKFIIKKLIDYPDNKRKIHKKPIAKIGGIIIVINYTFFLLIFGESFIDPKLYLVVILIFIVGLFDDIFNVNPFIRLGLIILLLIFCFEINQSFILDKIYLETFNRYISISSISLIFSIFCIVAIINAFNLFDGLNGLSISYFIIIFSYLFYKFYIIEFLPLILVLMILLFFNISNKLFLGDSGVYFLSSYLGLKIIQLHNFTEFNLSSEIIFLLLVIPGIDMARLFFERSINKKMFLSPDKEHLHHYLLTKIGDKKAVYFLVSILFLPLIIYETRLIPVYIIILIQLLLYAFTIIYLKKNAHKRK